MMKATIKYKESLAVTHPELSKQWHPEKNGKLIADDFTAGSHKKIWWWCEKGHIWHELRT